jgi:hypothetical protein
MDDRVSDDVARGRWMAITVTRIAGVVMVVVGIFGLQRVIDLPEIAAYGLIVIGLLDVFLIPQLLARKWRSHRE